VSAVAKRLHLSPSSVYAYRKGTTLPPPVVLDQILQELGVPAVDLGRMAELREKAGNGRAPGRRGSGPVGYQFTEPVERPWQLPPDVRGFTGRADELARLDDLFEARAGSTGPTVVLVSGTAGVGKTALVIHWAHQVREEFPDGSLYVDLRGFDPERPLEPVQVLGTFLRSLGTSREKVPSDLTERTALFRAALDRKRVLLFLDNAESEEQVRPLLPNSPGSLVVVTSRNRLNGLIARHGAHHVPVPHLPVEDAITLLEVLIGNDRVAEDQDGAAALVKRCALLPLAIRLGAELATTRRRAGLADLASELRRYQLDLFSAGGDERTAIRTVFSWSYLHLRAERARAFRLLGLHPGHDLDVHTCAALIDVDIPEAQRRIDDLVRANLLEDAGHERYRMHDLLGAYAREEAERDDPIGADNAMHRLFDHYLGTCATAMRLVAPDDTESHTAIAIPVTVIPLRTAERAMDWLDAERRNVLILADFAANGNWPGRAIQFSALMCRYLDVRGHYSDAMVLHTLGLKVARNHGRADLEAWELARIGVVHSRLGQLAEAQDYLLSAMRINDPAGNPRLTCRGLRHLGQICAQLGENREALRVLSEALPIARALEDHGIEAYVLSNLGVVHDQLGEGEQAIAYHHAAFTIAAQLSDHDLLGHVLNNIGAHHRRSAVDKAKSCHCTALEVARAAGNPALEASALLHSGTLFLECGQPGPARRLLTSARTIAAGFGNRDVGTQVSRLLDEPV
jgi:tetratricopeptide (TPR) repeat protein